MSVKQSGNPVKHRRDCDKRLYGHVRYDLLAAGWRVELCCRCRADITPFKKLYTALSTAERAAKIAESASQKAQFTGLPEPGSRPAADPA